MSTASSTDVFSESGTFRVASCRRRRRRGRRCRGPVAMQCPSLTRNRAGSPTFTATAVFVVLLVVSDVGVDASRGPPRISEVVEPIVGNIGETLKLPCPVDGEPAPLFEWFKDGESLIMADDRIRATKNVLKIKEAEVDDSGIYECKAVNGFGQVTLEVELWIRDSPSMSGGGAVYDDEEEEEEDGGGLGYHHGGRHRPHGTGNKLDSAAGDVASGTSDGVGGGAPNPNSNPNPPPPAPPRLVDHSWGDGAGPMMGGVFRQVPGSAIRLRCVALGEPRPWVKWYKDGVEQSGTDWRSKIETRWSFVIENLRRADSGVYTCRAGNKLGSTSVNFTLEVFDEMTDKPEMVDEHPMNTTVVAGESTTLQCRVKSDSQPRIQWLKRLESRGEEARYLNESVPLQGDRYRILNTSDTANVAKDTYLNRLTVPSTRREDAGLYVCLAANKMGYSFRKAYLTVEPSSARPVATIAGEDASPDSVGYVPESSTSIYVAVAAVACVMIVVLVVTSMCYLKRKYNPVGSGSPGHGGGGGGGGVGGPSMTRVGNGNLVIGGGVRPMNGGGGGGLGVGCYAANPQGGVVGGGGHHFDAVPGFGGASPNNKKAAIVVSNGGGGGGGVGQHQHFLTAAGDRQHHQHLDMQQQQQTAVLGGLRAGNNPSMGAEDYLARQHRGGYKPVPQQDHLPTAYAHQPVIYRDSASSDVSSAHLYQKLPLGSSAASPNGLVGGGVGGGPGSRSAPSDSMSNNYRVFGSNTNSGSSTHAHNNQQLHQHLHQHQQQAPLFNGVGGGAPVGHLPQGRQFWQPQGNNNNRDFVHFSSAGMSHPV